MLGLATYTPSEVDALFAAFDPDGSGEITFRELCAHRVPSSLSLSLSLSLHIPLPFFFRPQICCGPVVLLFQTLWHR